MKKLNLLFCVSLLIVSCSKDPNSDTIQMGSFTYTISGATTKTITGTNARFGSVGSFNQTFIILTVDTDEFEIRIVADPAATGTYLVNPMVIQGEGGQIINIPIEPDDSWADLGIGSSLANDRRSFSTGSANGGSLIITRIEGNTMEGSFSMSLMELLGGNDPFNNPKISVQGSFTAIKQ